MSVPRGRLKPLIQSSFKLHGFQVCTFGLWHTTYTVHLHKSRPIDMRAKILYLANQWMDFKMISISGRFLDLVVFLLPAFLLPRTLQFIAQSWSICPFSSTVLPDSHSHRNESSSRAGRMEEREDEQKIFFIPLQNCHAIPKVCKSMDLEPHVIK